MSTEIRVPTLGESVTEATISQWYKAEGDAVAADEPLLELETDKVAIEVPAPTAGTLATIVVKEGETVEVGALLGAIGEGAYLKEEAPVEKKPEARPNGDASSGASGGESVDIVVPTLGESVTEATVAQWFKSVGETVNADEPLVELETDKVAVEVPAPSAGVLSAIHVNEGETVEVGALLGALGGAGSQPAPKPAAAAPAPATPAPAVAADAPLAPSVRKIVEEHNLDPAHIAGTGKGGRITKADALSALTTPSAPVPAPAQAKSAPKPAPVVQVPAASGPREERVKMSRLRQTIARRLKEAQNTAAMLTTFNEVDMTEVMAVRAQYKELFERKHGVKLGFMSFFVKACVVGLKDIPAINAEIEGDEIVYKNYYDLGVAVGTDKGLVVPVLRDTDEKSLAQIEKDIQAYGKSARDGSLKLEDLQGGTFTISNGGVYGSLMSTPILNAPQSGVLGMHKIQQRPMVVDGKVEVRPMMYLALSYDHRIVDGKEAVTFLVRVKECLEDPQRMLLDL